VDDEYIEKLVTSSLPAYNEFVINPALLGSGSPSPSGGFEGGVIGAPSPAETILGAQNAKKCFFTAKMSHTDHGLLVWGRHFRSSTFVGLADAQDRYS